MNKMIDLHSVWAQRLKLIAEGDRLMAEAYKLSIKTYDQTKSADLRAKGYKCYLSSIQVWEKAVRAEYGKDIKLEWKNWNEQFQSYECHLPNGGVYGFDKITQKADSGESGQADPWRDSETEEVRQ